MLPISLTANLKGIEARGYYYIQNYKPSPSLRSAACRVVRVQKNVIYDMI